MPTAAPQVRLAIASAQRRAPQCVRAFTLIELMVTIAVASVLLAIAVPSFNQLIVANRLTAQANEVVAALNFARSEAIKRNTRVSFCRVEPANPDVCANRAGAWRNWIVAPAAGGDVVRRGVVNNFSGGIAVRSTLTGDQVMFGPEGLARTGGAIVSNQRISICSPQGGTGRRVVLGSGSRLSTEPFTGNCGP
jgi:type IV fimbrial biogenesis protein FimT